MLGLNNAWIEIAYPGGISDLPTPRGPHVLDFVWGVRICPTLAGTMLKVLRISSGLGCSDSRCVFISDVDAMVQGRTFQGGEVCKALKHSEI